MRRLNEAAETGRPRSSVDRHATSAAKRPPITFVAEDEPMMNEGVAMVLARIVRALREQRKAAAA